MDAATVIAPYAWMAEILTKAAFVAGAREGAGLLRGLGVAGLLIEGPDAMRTVGPFRSFLAPVGAAA
jgi:thiamine biosynthesis lipoprotein ApbE